MKARLRQRAIQILLRIGNLSCRCTKAPVQLHNQHAFATAARFEGVLIQHGIGTAFCGPGLSRRKHHTWTGRRNRATSLGRTSREQRNRQIDAGSHVQSLLCCTIRHTNRCRQTSRSEQHHRAGQPPTPYRSWPPRPIVSSRLGLCRRPFVSRPHRSVKSLHLTIPLPSYSNRHQMVQRSPAARSLLKFLDGNGR